MFIKSLSLTNFQKHDKLTLDFKSGVNYIYGASDAGKSCIRRAIGFVFFGDPRTDVIRREGTKETSVRAVLDNGVEIERVKSASKNKYIITINGKETVYDSIGASIPDDVIQILQMNTINIDDKEKPLNLNIAEQISLPFLMDKSPSFRLKLFNKLTGNDLVDKLIQNFNKSILQIGRDIKVEQDFIETNKPKLEEVTIQHAKEVSLYGNLKLKREAILKQVEKYNNLFSLKGKLDVNASSLVMTRIALKDYKVISDELIGKIKVLIGKFTSLNNIKVAYENNKISIIQTTKEINTVKTTDFDIQSCRKNIERYDGLRRVLRSITENFDKRQEVILHIDAANGHIKDFEKKYKDLLTEAKVCPLCKQSTCEAH